MEFLNCKQFIMITMTKSVRNCFDVKKIYFIFYILLFFGEGEDLKKGRDILQNLNVEKNV